MKDLHSSLNKKVGWLIAAFFVLAFGIICKTFSDYGVTWDEAHHQAYGELILKWYLSFFSDTTAVRHDFLIFYGGFFDVLAGLAGCFSPWDPFEARHLLDALFGLWTVLMSFKIAQRIAGHLAGFFSSLFLLLQPVFYGHMFNNPVDIPLAAMISTTIYGMISSYDNLPSLSLKDLFKIGLPLGLALGIRVASLFVLLPCLGVYWLLWLESQRIQNKEFRGLSIWKTLSRLAFSLASVLAIAWPIMLVWWPWAQLNPLIHPLMAALKASKWDMTLQGMTVFFDGKYYGFFQAPSSYLFKSIVMTLPEFFFITLFIGGVSAVSSMIKDRKLTPKRVHISLILFALVFPISAATLFNTPKFDGYRHFLFLMPFLAILAAVSLTDLLRSRNVTMASNIRGRYRCLFSCSHGS